MPRHSYGIAPLSLEWPKSVDVVWGCAVTPVLSRPPRLNAGGDNLCVPHFWLRLPAGRSRLNWCFFRSPATSVHQPIPPPCLGRGSCRPPRICMFFVVGAPGGFSGASWKQFCNPVGPLRGFLERGSGEHRGGASGACLGYVFCRWHMFCGKVHQVPFAFPLVGLSWGSS